MTTAIEKKTVNTIVDMSKLTAEDIATIKATCTNQHPKDNRDLVTDSEFKLFLHVAGVSGLDPLRRQIHCTKMAGRLAIIADVNGLQARAEEFPDFKGIKFGVVLEGDDFVFDHDTQEVIKHQNNPFKVAKPIGAWCIVQREKKLPFVSLVKFSEYANPNNPLWNSKPSVMILKCAKSTALRLAFPSAFGGIYEQAEMDREENEVNPPPNPDGGGEKPRPEGGAVAASVTSKLKEKAGKKKADKPEPEDAQVVVEQAPQPQPQAKAATPPPVEAKPEPKPEPKAVLEQAAQKAAEVIGFEPVAKAKLGIVDVKDGETEEQAVARTRAEAAKATPAAMPGGPSAWTQCVELAAIYGKTPKETSEFLRGELGLATVGLKDITRIRMEMDSRWGNAVPPPSDDDHIPEATP